MLRKLRHSSIQNVTSKINEKQGLSVQLSENVKIVIMTIIIIDGESLMKMSGRYQLQETVIQKKSDHHANLMMDELL